MVQIMTPPMPIIVCLCGSSRFYGAFQEHLYLEELKGKIVLTMGFLPHVGPDEHHGMLGITEAQKEMLDNLHHRKIDLADEIFVLNVGGYIGHSTAREIEYALNQGKTINYLEPQNGVI